MKYQESFKWHFKKTQLFSFRDAERFLVKSGASREYTKLFVHNMLKKGEIFKIGKGYYTFFDNESVVGFAYAPFYYGLEYALTIQKIWTQMPNPVVITTRKVAPGSRTMGRSKVIIHRISKGMFFGFEYVDYSNLFVPVSDVEKTLIDLVYFRKRVSDEEMKLILERIDKRKLSAYLKKCNERLRSAVRGVLSRRVS